ncbi:MAG: hypothetical protein ABI619_05500 [Betaproteobacteria bacterium]
MIDKKYRILTPLVIAASASVLAFSGIGVAAITGHLSITNSSLNPFSNFSQTAVSSLVEAPVAVTQMHQGLTRHRGEDITEGKPVDYKFGARVPKRKSQCPECGVVDSIVPREVKTLPAGVSHSLTAGTDGATILKASSQSVGSQAATAKGGFVVTLHMENGTVRTIYEADRPDLSIGERIKLVNGLVIRMG